MSRETRIRAASHVITAALEAGHATPGELAEALDDCCLLQSPETAAELDRLRTLSAGGTP